MSLKFNSRDIKKNHNIPIRSVISFLLQNGMARSTSTSFNVSVVNGDLVYTMAYRTPQHKHHNSLRPQANRCDSPKSRDGQEYFSSYHKQDATYV